MEIYKNKIDADIYIGILYYWSTFDFEVFSGAYSLDFTLYFIWLEYNVEMDKL